MSAASITKAVLVICFGAALGAAFLIRAYLVQRVGDWLPETKATVTGAVMGAFLAAGTYWRVIGYSCSGVALGGAGAAALIEGHECDGSIFLVLGIGFVVGGIVGGAIDHIFGCTAKKDQIGRAHV